MNRIYILKFGPNKRIFRVKSNLKDLLKGLSDTLEWDVIDQNPNYNGCIGFTRCRAFVVYVYTMGYSGVL